ncbi:uncharacterized protein JCM6883_003705 [Sporobolomyces salmoneus]|uniref:uncharacterized protein n=1 Tax=Sporobolomyces salmoneus TaxID=183962 RepID=UPI00316FE884
MAQPRANVAGAAQPEGGGGLLSSPLVKAGLQAAAIWAITQALFGKKAVNEPAVTPSNLNHQDPASLPVPPPANNRNAKPLPPVTPLYQPGTLFDVALQLSTLSDEEARSNPARVLKSAAETGLPGKKFEGIKWNNDGVERVWEIDWDVPTAVQQNSSLYLDIFLTWSPLNSPEEHRSQIPHGGFNFDGSEGEYRPAEWVHSRKLLTRYQPQRKVRTMKKLLSGPSSSTSEESAVTAAEEEEDSKLPQPIVSFYHPNVSVEIVCDSGVLPYHSLPPPVKSHIQLAQQKSSDGKEYYLPPVFVNDFWLLKGQMNPINSTTPTLPLRVTLKPTSHFKFQIFASMQDSFEKQSSSPSPAGLGGGSGGELDAFKSMLLETSPWLLITTAVVSILHMLFEFLAFSSDVKHWRGKKEMVGVSVRTILVNVFTQIVVFLFLLDSSEETSWMILLSSGMGIMIEVWKITKAVDIKLVPAQAGSILPYRIEIKDKHVLSEDEEKTKEYDKLAYKYVSWTMLPLLAAYTIYSLFANEHASWWSFSVKTLYSFISIMGFVQLVPQLIINYKLKSVAHIPMKSMMYKFTTTIIDDFFSFVVPMPLLHRLAAFRDDVVFLILLYQRWIYRVDPTRENEYGQKLSDEAAKKLLEDQEKKDR